MKQIQYFTVKKDKHRTARGGYSRFLNIYCEHCGKHLLLYQKDGPGPLKRMYLDRIFAPQNLRDLQHILQSKDIPQLFCSNCKKLIAIPAVYEKEKRNTLLLLSCAIIKKVGKGIYPPKEIRISV